ncbi:MAG TPA: hypothetical protein PKY81_17005 [bacterium]|nr:hypothetical protein [bacterium]
MKKFNVAVEGISPLLMNRPGFEIGDKSPAKKSKDLSAIEIAETKLYQINGQIYQPATHFQSALVEGGKSVKQTGKGSSKSTYSKVMGYAVEINPFEIIHKFFEWEVFSCLTVNPTTRGRNLTHRPMFRKWELEFSVCFDDKEVSSEILKEIFDITGRIVGIGDWRPAKKGRFGKFHITQWKEEK